MKRLALTFLMVLSLYGGVTLAGAQPALAQGSGHNHGSGPHGGQIGDAEPFHVEMVANKSQLDIYLYDQNMKPGESGEGFYAATKLTRYSSSHEAVFRLRRMESLPGALRVRL